MKYKYGKSGQNVQHPIIDIPKKKKILKYIEYLSRCMVCMNKYLALIRAIEYFLPKVEESYTLSQECRKSKVYVQMCNHLKCAFALPINYCTWIIYHYNLIITSKGGEGIWNRIQINTIPILKPTIRQCNCSGVYRWSLTVKPDFCYRIKLIKVVFINPFRDQKIHGWNSRPPNGKESCVEETLKITLPRHTHAHAADPGISAQRFFD